MPLLRTTPLVQLLFHIDISRQVAADGGCEWVVVYRMIEGYRAREALKCVLSNRGLGTYIRKLATWRRKIFVWACVGEPCTASVVVGQQSTALASFSKPLNASAGAGELFTASAATCLGAIHSMHLDCNRRKRGVGGVW